MKNRTLILLILFTIPMLAQEEISLEKCYNLVTTNYPLAKQHELLAKQNTLDIETIKTEKLPSIDLAGQATYQSDVIEFPFSIPNITVEPLNKDQYKATLNVNQLIYAGGLVNATIDLKKANLKTQQKEVAVSLYSLKNKINQVYFSIILLQEKTALLTSKIKQLEAKLKEIKAGIKYGIILPASDQVLEAEILKIDQQILETDLNRTSLISTLSSLIGKELDNTIKLEKPSYNLDFTSNIQRPELNLFELRKEQINKTEALTKKQKAPKLIGFAQGGYGNPGLNMLDNSFQTYYIVGLKLNWNVFDWNANKKQRQSLKINKDIIDTTSEVFKLNTSIELEQQKSEIEKITTFIATDQTIIELRKKVLATAASQLKHGVITSSAYITELTNLYEAENNLSTHQTQLLMSKANYQVTKGL
ncbi:TolC family protein [Aureibaculum sp. A20]|uniref:TolC family protein n=1 Tax=Aureibaculum flavum TaxID=2795986 RepID=A0ABS0WW21_9FLAO|nr:TolC family protein [Aureibaculum flavum]MBJ2176184.1 TolC family protein [Aureibaculum flavum]